jgi:uncharacterized protein
MKRLLLALLALAGCTGAATSETPPKPAMWKVADADTTIYLFGTIHMLPKDYAWRTPQFDAVAAQADELVLEIVPEGNAAAHAQAMKALAYSPGLPPLRDRVPAEKRAGLDALIAKAGLKPGQLDGLETWAAASALGAVGYRDLGASHADGVESQLSASFRSNNKPVSALETTMGQLSLFDTLPEQTQRRFLTSMIEDQADITMDFTAMLKAWSSGNPAKIAASFDEELKESPELAEVFMTRRNADWTDWIKTRLDRPGTVMVAVGAGHLAGKDSVQAMLAKQGLKVTRVQ